MANVGQNIATARKQAGLTQEELAARVGYKTKSAINKIELGIRELPQKKIKLFADALGVRPGHLMGWDVPASEAGALAAKVLKDPEAFQFMKDFMELGEADRYALRLAMETVKAKNIKKATDAEASVVEVEVE